MKLRYLPVNRAWVFVVGDSIVPMDGQHIFNKRVDAVTAAGRCGLTVARNGEVSVIRDTKEANR